MPIETVSRHQILKGQSSPSLPKKDTVAVPEVPSTVDAATKEWMQQVKHLLERREGQRRGTEGAKVVTFDDLETAGLYSRETQTFTSTKTSGDTIPPGPPTNFKVTAGGSFNLLSWTNPTDADLSYVEVFCHQVNLQEQPIRSEATRLAIIQKPMEVYYHNSLSPTSRYGYWVRAVDTSDNRSQWTPNDTTEAPVVVDPDPLPWQQEIYDLVFGDLAKNPLVLALNEKIEVVGSFWSADTDYYAFDVVIHGGSIWQAKKDNKGRIPVTGSQFWDGPWQDMSQVTANTGRTVVETAEEFESRINAVTAEDGQFVSSIRQYADSVSLSASQTQFKNLISGVVPVHDRNVSYVIGDLVLYAPTGGSSQTYKCRRPSLGFLPTNTNYWTPYGQIGQQVESQAAKLEVLPDTIKSEVSKMTFNMGGGKTTTLASAVQQLAGSYTVRIQGSGNAQYATGFGLALDPATGTSTFAVQATKFFLTDTGVAPTGVFGVDTVKKKVFIKGDLFVDGMIKTNHLAAESITATKIAANAVNANTAIFGTLDADKVNIINLKAGNIVSGTINAQKVTITNLDASKITAGTMGASRILLDGTPLDQLFSGVVWAMDAKNIASGSPADSKMVLNKVGRHVIQISGKLVARAYEVGTPPARWVTFSVVNKTNTRSIYKTFTVNAEVGETKHFSTTIITDDSTPPCKLLVSYSSYKPSHPLTAATVITASLSDCTVFGQTYRTIS